MSYENDETRAERELNQMLNPTPPEEQVPPVEEKPEQKAAEPAAEKPSEEDAYKQRYLTLQGMFRSEREKWTAEKNQLLSDLQALRQQSEQNENVEVEEDYRSPHVTEATRQSLAYRRMAELNGQRHTEIHFESLAMMQPSPSEPKADQQVSNTFLQGLDRLVPAWRQLNSNPAFLAFLQSPLPYSGGMTLQDKLDQAVQAQDAAAAAQFFIDFSEQQHKPATTVSNTPEALVAPAKHGSAAQTTAENHQGKVYTLAEWNAGWKKLELGKLSAKEAAALEADLTNAPGENRIVG